MGHEAAARMRLAAALANQPDLQDRFGRPIMEGGGYTVNFTQPPVYTAEKIAAALDRPDLPLGTFRVSLVSRISLLLVNGVPTEELALCAMPKAMLQATAAADTSAPPAPPADSAHVEKPGADVIQLTDSPDLPDSPAPPKETPDGTA